MIEICLIRYRGHLACLNTFNCSCGWLLGLSLGLVSCHWSRLVSRDLMPPSDWLPCCAGGARPVPLLRPLRAEPPVPGPRLAAARVPGVAAEAGPGAGGEADTAVAQRPRIRRRARAAGESWQRTFAKLHCARVSERIIHYEKSCTGMNVFRNGMNSFQNGMNVFRTGMKTFRIGTGIWGNQNYQKIRNWKYQ